MFLKGKSVGLIITAAVLLVSGISISLYLALKEDSLPELSENGDLMYGGIPDDVNFYYPEIYHEYSLSESGMHNDADGPLCRTGSRTAETDFTYRAQFPGRELDNLCIADPEVPDDFLLKC